MALNINLILILVFALSSLKSDISVDAADDGCRALITYEIDKDQNNVTVFAKAINNGKGSFNVHYDLKIMKKGPSGSSTASQSGIKTIGSLDTLICSKQMLDYIPGNEYEVSLKIKTKDGFTCESFKSFGYEK